MLNEKLHIEATLAASSLHHGLERIGHGYREALMALDYKLIKGQNTIIFYEDIQGIEQRNYHYPMELEGQLINFAKSGDYGSIERLLDHIYGMNVTDRGITPEMGRCLFVDMLNTVQKLLGSLPLDEGVAVRGERDPVKAILGCATTVEMLEETKAWYGSICSALKDERTDHRERLFAKMTTYVEECYTDSNFSLTAMADHLELTPQYLSSFFKKYSGQNISDYITGVRVEHAKRLLADPALTIAQIALKVGYANDPGFIRVFKKVEGITPGKYRESLETGLNPS